MNRLYRLLSALALCMTALHAQEKRIVILKVDGLNEDLLEHFVAQVNPETGKSQLPWIQHIFFDGGTVFHNFYSRGISLSAPSWSILDTGHHAVIRGNVEFDRYTGHSYDYLNFFPFYVGYAQRKQVDMPGVEVLDRAGVPLLMDSFGKGETYQSFQLLQRRVRWDSLTEVLKRRFATGAIISTVEEAGAPSYDELIHTQTDSELAALLAKSKVLYADFYDADVDHEGHATSQQEALLDELRRVDARAGRLWTEIQKSPLAQSTVFAMVSDHGMNNVPGIVSQTYSITDFFGTPEGGGHHVVTDRRQLSDFKLLGLDPFTTRVVNPSKTSFYLEGESNRYPTAWLDIDGNERTAVGLRNNDVNRIHILLKQLARTDLLGVQRKAVAAYVQALIDKNCARWTKTNQQLSEELTTVSQTIAARKRKINQKNIDDLRLRKQLSDWQEEISGYTAYLQHLRKLLAFKPDPKDALREKVDSFIPEMSQGDNNSVGQIQHYVVGLSAVGITLDSQGNLDESATFRHINYPEVLMRQRAHNVPQAQLSDQPIDFVAMSLPDQHSYWLYKTDVEQLVIETNASGQIRLRPVSGLNQQDAGEPVSVQDVAWHHGLPLALYEDSELHIPAGVDRGAWLSSWHSEREWMEAIHECRYSNGVIGIIEELSPIEPIIPGKPDMDPVMLRYEKRRRLLVQADFHIFAADHWNFNVRFPNPGGNHGAFFRISTHSVWMMAGHGIPKQAINEPYDGLNFGSTVLSILGKPVPMPDRVVQLTP